MDAYSPFSRRGTQRCAASAEERNAAHGALSPGLIGGISGYLLQVWGSVWSYPLNIGGRPLNSWPAFVPITFELTILFAALAAVFGMLGLNGFPMPYPSGL